ncbi:MAG: twin-arginine translocase TatA/TatE family subunit [Meiothermus sp.]
MLAGQDLIVVLAIALLLLGPKQLPGLAKGLGQSIREFKKGTEGIIEEAKPTEAADSIKSDEKTKA